MTISILFGQRRSQPEAIEVMVSWDEYCIDSNPGGFEEACEEAKKSWGDELLQWRVIDIEVAEDEVQDRFTNPTLKGTLQ